MCTFNFFFFCFRRSLFCLPILIALWVVLCTDSLPSTATPSAVRLAILEIQGTFGTLKERQRWSDEIRSVALENLMNTGIKIIDRSEFETLLPPDQSLSDCVGHCSTQIARSLGAHWVLSTHIEEQQALIYLSLKLHSVDGTLQSITQEQLPKDQVIEQFSKRLHRVTLKALNPIAPIQTQHLPEPQLEPKDTNHRTVLTPQVPKRSTALRWWIQEGMYGIRCLSERIRWEEYQSCVHHGDCSEPPQREGCDQELGHAVRCLDFSQALSYVNWLRQQDGFANSELRALPTHPELISLNQHHPEAFDSIGTVHTEWIVTTSSPTHPLHGRALKVASKEQTAQRVQGQIQTRPFPPAFQLPQLGFRLSILSDRKSCPQLPSSFKDH